MALAARRLSIIDLAGGDQPIGNEDGRIQVVQNGEIYNYRQLRERLERAGHKFATRSDTEVLVHLYEEHGPAFVEDLRGMFAIALWDRLEHRLVLARDRFGIKPLYYRIEGRRAVVRVGAEGAAAPARLLARGRPRRARGVPGLQLDPGAADDLRRGAQAAAGPHPAVASGASRRLRRYARPRPAPAGRERAENERELAEELRERLRDSVRAHLVADVPVGVLLSGGIDSSALAALAARESSYRVSTFSIGFEERSFNELEQARLVAEQYGTDHHELIVRPDAVELLPRLARGVRRAVRRLVRAPDLPGLPAGRRHRQGRALRRGRRRAVRRLLHLRRRHARAAHRAAWRRRCARWSSGCRAPPAKVSFDYKAKRFARAAHLPPLERHHGWKEIFSPEARAALLDGRRGAVDPLDVYRARYAETEGADELARLQDVDIGIYLADDLLVKTDRASMAHSLEARVPFCDPVVAELALALPRRMKVRGLSKKRLLRNAVSTLLPRAIVRGRKQGFSIPAAAWLRGDLEPFARDVLSPERLRARASSARRR